LADIHGGLWTNLSKTFALGRRRLPQGRGGERPRSACPRRRPLKLLANYRRWDEFSEIDGNASAAMAGERVAQRPVNNSAP
jgi:hypothetical protein